MGNKGTDLRKPTQRASVIGTARSWVFSHAAIPKKARAAEANSHQVSLQVSGKEGDCLRVIFDGYFLPWLL